MGGRHEPTNFWLGAVGIRTDGARVFSRNGRSPLMGVHHHCEARLCRKLSNGSVIYLARVTRLGEWAMAKPCFRCDRVLRNREIAKVYYTVSPGVFGIWQPD